LWVQIRWGVHHRRPHQDRRLVPRLCPPRGALNESGSVFFARCVYCCCLVGLLLCLDRACVSSGWCRITCGWYNCNCVGYYLLVGKRDSVLCSAGNDLVELSLSSVDGCVIGVVLTAKCKVCWCQSLCSVLCFAVHASRNFELLLSYLCHC
jgi:hypothetical protein